MNDIENFVFDAVATQLRSAYSGIFVSGEYVEVPASFPTATIVQEDSSVLEKMSTEKRLENATTLLFDVNVYSNKVGYKKQQAKEIMSTIDEKMAGLGFTRIFCNPMPNLMDSTIFRLSARYRGVVMKERNNTDTTMRIYQN